MDISDSLLRNQKSIEEKAPYICEGPKEKAPALVPDSGVDVFTSIPIENVLEICFLDSAAFGDVLIVLPDFLVDHQKGKNALERVFDCCAVADLGIRLEEGLSVVVHACLVLGAQLVVEDDLVYEVLHLALDDGHVKKSDDSVDQRQHQS